MNRAVDYAETTTNFTEMWKESELKWYSRQNVEVIMKYT